MKKAKYEMGFYSVKYLGAWNVAERVKDGWFLPGLTDMLVDSDLDEIDKKRIITGHEHEYWYDTREM